MGKIYKKKEQKNENGTSCSTRNEINESVHLIIWKRERMRERERETRSNAYTYIQRHAIKYSFLFSVGIIF